MFKKCMLVLIVVNLFGCANSRTTSVDCSGDWKQIGLETAMAGKTVRTLDEYIAVCGKTALDGKSAYLDGYAKGIVQYCSKDNGYAIGIKNIELPQVCPYELRPVFEKGYKIGLTEYKLNKEQFEQLQRRNERDTANGKHNVSSAIEPGGGR
jgi:hypothetical protein